MEPVGVLLRREVSRATDVTWQELGRLLGCSSVGAKAAFAHSRTVYEQTAPKKRNPSQHRVMVLLSQRQKAVNRTLKGYLDCEEVDPAVHGYVPGRSIWTALAAHFEGDRPARPLAWYGFDIADAFPSVSHRWIRRLVSEIFPGVSPAAQSILVNLLCYRGRLNPGYPTSPVLFNLALRPLDRELARYCAARGIVYTRYADDFTFSAGRDFSAQEKRELQRLASRPPYRFRVIKQDQASLGESFLVTHRSSERFRRRILRDTARGVSPAETIANLQAGRG